MAQTLTATPDPTYSPPRIRLDFTDTAATPVTSVTINRQNASGRVYPVRTSDGGPLPTSGGAATVFDYEAPPEQLLTYSTTITGGPTATATLLPVPAVRLIHPGIPSRSMSIQLRRATNAQEDWDIQQGSFAVLGRSTPIVATGGARIAAASSLIVAISSDDERLALKQLLSDGAPLLLSVAPSLGFGLESAYIAIGKVSSARPVDLGTVQERDIVLPYQVVARPAGGTRGGLTWDKVAATYPTWADLAATGMTWAQLAAQSA